jgi:type VI secretion system protein ImpF
VAELTDVQRLQPCLLDRLTDTEPDKSVEGRDRRVFTISQVRAAVLRDLGWLLNTSVRVESEDLVGLPLVASSVLNYGMPDLCGLSTKAYSPSELERMVRESIRRFEPRILPETLSVKVVEVDTNGRASIAFEVSADLWATPMPDPLFFRTEMDLDTGQCRLEDRPNG